MSKIQYKAVSCRCKFLQKLDMMKLMFEISKEPQKMLCANYYIYPPPPPTDTLKPISETSITMKVFYSGIKRFTFYSKKKGMHV